jgi:hypothetical protein
MTVFGENPGLEDVDFMRLDSIGEKQTHVAYITGVTVAGGNADVTALITGTSSVTVGGTNTTATYLVVGGW